jgi:hypothetical protein
MVRGWWCWSAAAVWRERRARGGPDSSSWDPHLPLEPRPSPPTPQRSSWSSTPRPPSTRSSAAAATRCTAPPRPARRWGRARGRAGGRPLQEAAPRAPGVRRAGPEIQALAAHSPSPAPTPRPPARRARGTVVGGAAAHDARGGGRHAVRGAVGGARGGRPGQEHVPGLSSTCRAAGATCGAADVLRPPSPPSPHPPPRPSSFLHSRGFIHGDLRSPNLFVDEHGHIRIGDFGFAHNLPRRSAKVCLWPGARGLPRASPRPLRSVARPRLWSPPRPRSNLWPDSPPLPTPPPHPRHARSRSRPAPTRAGSRPRCRRRWK